MKRLKKLSIILTVFFCVMTVLSQNGKSSLAAEEQEITYAYLNKAVMLYMMEENAAEEVSYVSKTMLPPTYFVALLEEFDTENEYILVNYLDLNGYVKKSEIEIVDYEPVTKYASGELITSNFGYPVQLRIDPYHDEDNIIADIPDESPLLYYGTVEGSSMWPQLGNIWYYVRYTNGDNIFYGYIYNAYVQAQRISNNVIEKVEKPIINLPPVDNDSPVFDTTSAAIFAVCLSVPAILIMLYLFYSPGEKKRQPRQFKE